MKQLLSILFFSLILFSCKKDVKLVDFQFDYYGLQEGRYIVYQVREVEHTNGSAGVITQDYQLKTVIGDTVIDNDGNIARKYFRYTRADVFQDWELVDVWSSRIADFRAELVEENVRVVKMVFKPTSDKIWDGNAYNILSKQEYYYEDINDPFELPYYSFDSTLRVVQALDSNFIEYKNQYEIYAKGVGMVKKFYKDLNINFGDPDDVNYGKELYMECIEYGFQ